MSEIPGNGITYLAATATNVAATTSNWLTMPTPGVYTLGGYGPAAPMSSLPPVPMTDRDLESQVEDAKHSPHAALLGYRAWSIDLYSAAGPLLLSLNGTPWPPRAALKAHAELQPRMPGVGIHAARSHSHLYHLGYTGSVVGDVYLWGKVIHGSMGFRATYAYPKKLYVGEQFWWTDELSKRYGIPVEIMR